MILLTLKCQGLSGHLMNKEPVKWSFTDALANITLVVFIILLVAWMQSDNHTNDKYNHCTEKFSNKTQRVGCFGGVS